MVLTRGWQTFARARGLGGRWTLHFKYDGLATLYVRVFRGTAAAWGAAWRTAATMMAATTSLDLVTRSPPPVMAALPRTRAQAAVAMTGPCIIMLVSRTLVVLPAAAL